MQEVPVWGRPWGRGVFLESGKKTLVFTRGQLQVCLIPGQFLILSPPPPKVWSKFLLPLISAVPNKVSSAGWIQNRCFDAPPPRQTPLGLCTGGSGPGSCGSRLWLCLPYFLIKCVSCLWTWRSWGSHLSHYSHPPPPVRHSPQYGG